MKQVLVMVIGLFIILLGTSAVGLPIDWQVVEDIFGRKGAAQADLFKITFPRTDLSVKIGEVPVEPGLALTTWLGFKGMGKQSMMMGDMVLLENEVAPVMASLVKSGIRVTALHNHLIGTTPVIMYLHFSGEETPANLAAAMRTALALTATPLGVSAPLSPSPPPVDWSRVEAVFGKAGSHKGNLFQTAFPRKETILEKGMEVPPFLGMATGINLQMVGTKAATTGDFVLLADEVNPVVRTLTEHGIAVTAIHSHMLFESPRLFFLHFWGYDEPEKLARGLKAALDRTNSVK